MHSSHFRRAVPALLAGLFVFAGTMALHSPSQATELKMNTVEFCPETPYEKWYPFNKTTMRLDGKVQITRDTISFTRHGTFSFITHTMDEGFTYLELLNVPHKKNFGAFIYLKYHKFVLTYAEKSCFLKVYACTTQEGVEHIVRSRNALPSQDGHKAYCSSMSFIRDEDRERMTGLIPPDIHD